MSMFFKRIGKKKNVYSVDITVHSIKLSLKVEAGISIIWKRKKKRIETSNRHKLLLTSGVLEINETLTMINTMYQEKSGDFIKKSAELTIQAHIDKKGMKKVGKANIDLSAYTAGAIQQYFPLSDCPDRKASICVSVKFTPIGESTMVDAMSEASGRSEISMGTEGDYSGPLFHEQDSRELDEEYKGNTLKPKKPPRTKRKSESQMDSLINVDNQAMINVLQKENQQLKSEKDEIRLQFELISEKSKKERENYCLYVEKLEKNIDSLTRKNRRLKEKYSEAKENTAEKEKSYLESLSDFEEYKARYNHQEKKKLKDQIKSLQLSFQKAEQEKFKGLSMVEELTFEKTAHEETIKSLQGLNAHLSKQLESLKEIPPVVIEEPVKEVEEEKTSQNKSQKKLQEQLKSLRIEHKEAQEEIEELRIKQTEYISTIQQLKKNHVAIEDELKDTIRRLENELTEKISEINELEIRLDEEIENSRKFERKTITVKEESEDKFSKLAQNLKVLSTEKLALEANYLDSQRKQDRQKQGNEAAVLAKLEGTIAANEKEINRLNDLITDKSRLLDAAAKSIERLETENSLLQDHLKTAEASEFSDPATTALQEKITFLEAKNTQLQLTYSEESEKLLENTRILEKQLEIMTKKHRESMRVLEEKCSSLIVENKMMKEQNKESNNLNTAEFLNSMNEENYKQSLEMLNIQVLEFKNGASKLAEELKVAEQKYQETKGLMVRKENDRENLQGKYREAQEQLREYSAQYTVLEVELYKINERFGQALNSNNLLENELQEMKDQIYNRKAIKRKN